MTYYKLSYLDHKNGAKAKNKVNKLKTNNVFHKVGGVGGCAKLNFFRQILCIYNYLGCEKTLALQSPKTKQI